MPYLPGMGFSLHPNDRCGEILALQRAHLLNLVEDGMPRTEMRCSLKAAHGRYCKSRLISYSLSNQATIIPHLMFLFPHKVVII